MPSTDNNNNLTIESIADAQNAWNSLLTKETLTPEDIATRTALVERYPELLTIRTADQRGSLLDAMAEQRQVLDGILATRNASPDTFDEAVAEAEAKAADVKVFNLVNALLQRRRALRKSQSSSNAAEIRHIEENIFAAVANATSVPLTVGDIRRMQRLYEVANRHQFTPIVSDQGPDAAARQAWLYTLRQLAQQTDGSTESKKSKNQLRGMIRQFGPTLVQDPSKPDQLSPDSLRFIKANRQCASMVVEAQFSRPAKPDMAALHDRAITCMALVQQNNNPQLKTAYSRHAMTCYQQLYKRIANGEAPPTNITPPDAAYRHIKASYFDAIKRNDLSRVLMLTHLYPQLFSEKKPTAPAKGLTPLLWACREQSQISINFLVKSPGLTKTALESTLIQLVDGCKQSSKKGGKEDSRYQYALDQLLRSATIIDEAMYQKILSYAEEQEAKAALNVLKAPGMLDHINRARPNSTTTADVAADALRIIQQPTGASTWSSINTEEQLSQVVQQAKQGYSNIPGYNIVSQSMISNTAADADRTLTCAQRLECTPSKGSANLPTQAQRLVVKTIVVPGKSSRIEVKGQASFTLQAQIVAQNFYAQALTGLKQGRHGRDGKVILGTIMQDAEIEKLAFCTVVHSLSYNTDEQLAELAMAFLRKKIFPVLTPSELKKTRDALALSGQRAAFETEYQKMEGVYLQHLQGKPPTTAEDQAHAHPGAVHLFEQLKADRKAFGQISQEAVASPVETSNALNQPRQPEVVPVPPSDTMTNANTNANTAPQKSTLSNTDRQRQTSEQQPNIRKQLYAELFDAIKKREQRQNKSLDSNPNNGGQASTSPDSDANNANTIKP